MPREIFFEKDAEWRAKEVLKTVGLFEDAEFSGCKAELEVEEEWRVLKGSCEMKRKDYPQIKYRLEFERSTIGGVLNIKINIGAE